jgi:hypothetical protein
LIIKHLVFCWNFIPKNSLKKKKNICEKNFFPKSWQTNATNIELLAKNLDYFRKKKFFNFLIVFGANFFHLGDTVFTRIIDVVYNHSCDVIEVRFCDVILVQFCDVIKVQFCVVIQGYVFKFWTLNGGSILDKKIFKIKFLLFIFIHISLSFLALTYDTH